MLPPMVPRPTNPIAGLVVELLDISRPPFDARDVLVAKLEMCRVDDRIHLVGAAEADDGAVNRRIAQRPGDCDRTRRRLMVPGHRSQPLHEGEMLGELWL